MWVNRKFFAVGGGLLCALGLTTVSVPAVSVAGPAEAGYSDYVLSDDVEPTVVSSAGSFYELDQMESVWRAVVGNYEEPLPPGMSFPSSLPLEIQETDATDPDADRVLFEVGYAEAVAAGFWRCAWLDMAIDNDDAELQARGRDFVDSFIDLDIATAYDRLSFLDYERSVEEEAELLDTDRYAIYFASECSAYQVEMQR